MVVATYGLADWLAGPLAVRVSGAWRRRRWCCSRRPGAPGRWAGGAARWTAVLVAALCVTPLIDVVAAKGELLGLPLVTAAACSRCWRCAARTARAPSCSRGRRGRVGDGAGHEAEPRRRPRLRRGAAAHRGPVPRGAADGAGPRWAPRRSGSRPAGAGRPWAGPSPPAYASRCWGTPSGLPGDASAVLAAEPASAPAERGRLLVLVAAGAAWSAVLGGFLVHVRDEAERDAPVTWAVLAVLAAGRRRARGRGSYWRDYLFALVPSTASARRCCRAGSPGAGGRCERWSGSRPSAARCRWRCGGSAVLGLQASTRPTTAARCGRRRAR